jgi:hypothetical protein
MAPREPRSFLISAGERTVEWSAASLSSNSRATLVHNTTYDALREVSPMLASRNGLDTAEMPLTDVAAKLAELVTVPAAA